MTTKEIRGLLDRGGYRENLARLYPSAPVGSPGDRLRYALERFEELHGTGRTARIFSAPGRTEIGGNHTDHQRGRVLAAAVDLDMICVAGENADGVIRLHSQGHDPNRVELDSLDPRAEEQNTSTALIRGIAARCRELGYRVGGFDAYTTSDVLSGSGLSSSAAFEVGVVTAINGLFNGGAIPPVTAAQIGQYAENHYFGKPCGLMDQTASAVGGFVAIDFADPRNPLVETVDCDLAAAGFSLCVVGTGGSHADLTHEYAAIPAEMGAVARFLGREYLGEGDAQGFYDRLPQARKACGDRPVLRALHFFGENERVKAQARALEAGNLAEFLNLVVESGRSSAVWLQNVFACSDPLEQGLGVALAVSEGMLAGSGAWRVHGGGFGGTILAVVPTGRVDAYAAGMDQLFGSGACRRLQVRQAGGVELVPDRAR